MTEKEIEGFDKMARALRESPEKVLPYLVQAMHKAIRSVQARLAAYPPATAANRPGRVDKNGRPMGYYERGRGWWYPVMHESSLGERLGVRFGVQTAQAAAKRAKTKEIAAVAGYKLRNGGQSELLGKSWAVNVESDPESVRGILGNNTSYADYVQGARQTAFHRANEWPDLDKALEDAQYEIDGAFWEAIGSNYASQELLG